MTISYVKTKTPADVERVDITHYRSAVEDLDTIRAHMAALKAEETETLAIIRAAIGTAQIGTIGGEDAVRLDERTNTSLDRDSVRTLLGNEAYASVLRHTPYIATVIVGKFKSGRK